MCKYFSGITNNGINHKNNDKYEALEKKLMSLASGEEFTAHELAKEVGVTVMSLAKVLCRRQDVKRLRAGQYHTERRYAPSVYVKI